MFTANRTVEEQKEEQAKISRYNKTARRNADLILYSILNNLVEQSFDEKDSILRKNDDDEDCGTHLNSSIKSSFCENKLTDEERAILDSPLT